MIMTKRIMVAALLPLLVIAFAGVSQAWQERMGGMGDAYGLLQDESDFLTHPSQIAQGGGVRFYGDYRFTYTDVMDWDYDLDRLDAPPYSHFYTSGTSNFAEYDLMSDLDAFAQRQSIEEPQGGFKPGGEVQIAYRQEENENWQQINLDGDGERKTPADNVLSLLKMDKARIEWSTGGGLSVLFDL
jgi:hypothetical protein